MAMAAPHPDKAAVLKWLKRTDFSVEFSVHGVHLHWERGTNGRSVMNATIGEAVAAAIELEDELLARGP